ncbi:hypothetical protein AC579_8416 [Pseudocercospora musae]|uniref:Uncharacterized protein n=1 Tax=Pseudocercospora musae TaxID=113226 RepID=A0A139II87_9PEZI|nr:hypothetical protein AC579_8416 [Pseudocercospora musae]
MRTVYTISLEQGRDRSIGMERQVELIDAPDTAKIGAFVGYVESMDYESDMWLESMLDYLRSQDRYQAMARRDFETMDLQSMHSYSFADKTVSKNKADTKSLQWELRCQPIQFNPEIVRTIQPHVHSFLRHLDVTADFRLESRVVLFAHNVFLMA